MAAERQRPTRRTARAPVRRARGQTSIALHRPAPAGVRTFNRPPVASRRWFRAVEVSDFVTDSDPPCRAHLLRLRGSRWYRGELGIAAPSWAIATAIVGGCLGLGRSGTVLPRHR